LIKLFLNQLIQGLENRIFDKVKGFLLKEQYQPSFLGFFINPFYFARKAIFNNIKMFSTEVNGTTLDIGCGSKPYSNLFNTEKYVGMDVEVTGHKHTDSKIDVFYDGLTFPFPDGSFDSIVCFEVLEHVFNPDIFLSEANRVLKPGGTAIFTVPFIWDEHEQPYDFARYSSFGLKHMFGKAGFVVVGNNKYLKDLRLLFLLFNTYIYKIIRKKIKGKLSMMLILPMTTFSNIIGLFFYLFPNNADLYFGNIFLLKK
jgi:SAM-dependent methyltransferase